MRFSNEKDNKKLIDRLSRVVEMDKVSHAYIFEGDWETHKTNFVKSFIKGILCGENLGENCGKCSICNKIDHDNHEDILYVQKDEASVKDYQVISIQERLKTKPYGSRNIVVVSHCDTMTDRAQNRLLKTLEEPPGNSVIFLLSENMENLAPTILSRCVKYRINHTKPGSNSEIEEKAETLMNISLAKKPFYMMKRELEPVLKDGEKIAALLDCMEIVYRNMLIEKKSGISFYKNEDIIKCILAVEKARRQIKHGVSSSYAVKNLLLEIGG